MTRSRLVVEVEDLEVIKQEVARAMQSRNSNLILCPFCLRNCFFLLAAHFAQILLSKFCQGLVGTGTANGYVHLWKQEMNTFFVSCKLTRIDIPH